MTVLISSPSVIRVEGMLYMSTKHVILTLLSIESMTSYELTHLDLYVADEGSLAYRPSRPAWHVAHC